MNLNIKFKSLFLVFLFILAFVDTSIATDLNKRIKAKQYQICYSLLHQSRFPELNRYVESQKRFFGDNPIFLSGLYYYKGLYHFDYTQKTDSAIYFYEKSLEYSKLSKDTGQIALTAGQLSFMYFNQRKQEKLNSLIAYIKKLMIITSGLEDKAHLHVVICNYYLNTDQDNLFITNAFQCIDRLKCCKLNDPVNRVFIGFLYYRMSVVFDKMQQTDKAFEYCRQAEAFYSEDEPENLALIYSYEVRSYCIKKKKNEAFGILDKIKKLKANSVYKDYALGGSFSCIAEYYLYQEQGKLALKYIDKAIYHCEKSNTGQLLIIAKILKAKILTHEKRYDEAIMVLKSLDEEAKKYNKSTYQNLTLNLANCYKKVHNYKDAMTYFEKYVAVNDSLLVESSNQNIANAEARYQNNVKKHEINSLKAQNTIQRLKEEKTKSQITVLLLLLIIVAGVSGFIYLKYKERKKTNEKLERLNSELDLANQTKTRFLGILNHDLRSPLANLIQFLHFKNDDPQLLDNQMKLKMEQMTILAAENLLTSMEDILLWSKGQMSNFEPCFEIISVDQLMKDLQNHFFSESRISMQFDYPSEMTLYTDLNFLKTIMRNLVGNAVKVLSARDLPTITLKAWQDEEKSYLSVSDNGAGAESEKFRALYDDTQVVGIKTGLGLHLVRDLSKAINCSIRVDSVPNVGTTFELSFLR